jgi:RimJ/RimL family protein N-acetyltransferase
MTEKSEARPLGRAVSNWSPRERPPREILTGRYVRLEPFDVVRHADALFAAYADTNWDYMAGGPFADAAAHRAYAERVMMSEDPFFYTIIDLEQGKPGGVASLMRIVPEHGAIEVGNIAYAPSFQRTRQATEAMYLLAVLVFDRLGYRRYEWKCNNLNAPSKRAAIRLGFHFEGVFRDHMVVKGRNRDTAWFAMTAEEWPARKAAFERWLDPANFDTSGMQKTRLSWLMPEGQGRDA